MICVLEVTSYPVQIAENGQFIDVSSRHNSDFNRLLSNNLAYSEYDKLNDNQQSNSDLNYDENSAEDIETSEYRHRLANRRRPCVPTYGKKARKQQRQQYRQNQQQNLQNQPYRDSARTLYDLNFYFLGYQPNNVPNKIQTNPADVETFVPAAATNGGGGQYNPYGSYDCSPNPLYQQSNFGGGNFGGNLLNGAYNDPARPSTWGLVGQSLYEFFNGLLGVAGPSADSPVSGAQAVLNDQQSSNNVRPVYEINVPDTIQALVKKTELLHIAHISIYCVQ